MAEYLAPGVYVEETTFRSRSIEGVSTSTTGFAGPTRRGPVGGTPELLTSFSDFERIYGGVADLTFDANTDADVARNHLALGVRAFFDNGGSRLYVSRVVNGATNATLAIAATTGTPTATATLNARFGGTAGQARVRFVEHRQAVSGTALDRLPVGSVVDTGTALVTKTATGWSATAPTTGELLTLDVEATDPDGATFTREGMSYAPTHARHVGAVLSANPARRSDALEQFVSLAITGTDLAEIRDLLVGAAPTSGERTRTHTLAGGGDGAVPTATQYATALEALDRILDISIVAAPGSSVFADGAAIRGALITHVSRRGSYRVAVLDSDIAQTPGEVRTSRGALDSDRAALYYPWVVISNPNARPGDLRQPAEVATAPSGFVAGIWARNDAERGVWKSPANEVVRGALRFETDLSFGEVESLNPFGVNCLRAMPSRGLRVWGARTASSDPEWKYLSVRRYFHYLEGSIDRGTQWAVFEPNGEGLWANIRETISSFLFNEWRAGALLGSSEREAYFVRCDRTTMTQNDLDNGRLVCLVGVAVVKPAEFVIFRIGQKTSTARD